MAEPLLQASGIEAAFGAGPRRVTVLHGIDIEIGRGETVGVVGESGSGKTTLGRVLLRLIDPVAGKIRFDGQDITALSEAALRPWRRRMQMIFQDPMASLNPRHKIRRILVQPVLLHGLVADDAAAERRIMGVLDRCGLPPGCLDRYPHELSGGQRQRVGIARAAALAPDLVVADEITSGLDVSTQAQVLALLRDLARQSGVAMVFISHNLSVVRAICDRVYVLRNGRVLEAGPCDRVFAAPQSGYTRALLDAIPLPEIDPQWLQRDAAEAGAP